MKMLLVLVINIKYFPCFYNENAVGLKLKCVNCELKNIIDFRDYNYMHLLAAKSFLSI